MATAPIDADVVVIGAGPVGAAAAIMVAKAGYGTLLLDRAEFPRDKVCGEGLLPAGAAVLAGLGVRVDGFPSLAGVSYVLHGSPGGSASGCYHGEPGRGTRRSRLDAELVDLAGCTPGLEVHLGCAATGVVLDEDSHVTAHTGHGEVRTTTLIGADGLHSSVAKWMGWARPSGRPGRFGLVGHFPVQQHGFDRVVVTLLDGCEVYAAPTGRDELLVAVLGNRQQLRGAVAGADGVSRTRQFYLDCARAAHPVLATVEPGSVKGAGPFWTRPERIAEGRVFLVGDAAGFLDPLTGDGMTCGLVGARHLARLLATAQLGPSGRNDRGRVARDYQRWESGQWRRRRLLAHLALALTGSSGLAGRAVRGLRRRPATLDKLLEVNDGTRSPLSLSPADWVALAGIA